MRNTFKNLSRRELEDRREALDYCYEILSPLGIVFKHEDVTGPARPADLVFIRALIVIALRNKGYSLVRIGKILNRDHATIINLTKYDQKTQGRDSSFEEIKFFLEREGSIHQAQKAIKRYKEMIKVLEKKIVDIRKELLKRAG